MFEWPSLTALAASLRDRAEGGVLLVGPGQFTPHPGAVRVCVLRVDGPAKPVQLWDGALPEADLPAFTAALSAFARVLPAELDTLAATRWNLAWTVPPAPFVLYRRRGLACLVEDDNLVLVDWLGRRATHHVDTLRHVLAWISKDWTSRGVSVVARSGAHLLVADHHERSAMTDPTYDGIDISIDASWTTHLAGALAVALDLPCELGDPVLPPSPFPRSPARTYRD
jgi:hypothetical protein